MSPGEPPKNPSEPNNEGPKISRREFLVGAAAVASLPKAPADPAVGKIIEAPASIEAAAETLSPGLAEAKQLLEQLAKDMPYEGNLIAWEVKKTGPIQDVNWLINEWDMGMAINEMPEGEAKARCDANLSKIYRLFEQEKKELEQKNKPNLPECGPLVKSAEDAMAAFEVKYNLEHFLSITTATVEEVLNDETRKAAIKDLGTLLQQLKTINKITNITTEQMDELSAKYGKLSSAIGIHGNGKIDHSLKQIKL